MVAEDVNLEQLPAYEEVGTAAAPDPPRTEHAQGLRQIYSPRPTTAPLAPPSAVDATATAAASLPLVSNPALAAVRAPTATVTPTPDEPPPGYEEAQQGSIAGDLEQTLRRRSARGGGRSDSE